VKVSPFKDGDAVLILGGGPIGISVILALKARGAGKIIVSEVSRRRQEFAEKFGAHYTLDPTREDVVKRCRELCDGQGVNVVYDCAGVQAGLDAGIHSLRARGTFVNIAIWEKGCTIVPNDLTFKERKYMGIATYQIGDFQEVIVSSLLATNRALSLLANRAPGRDIFGEDEATRHDHTKNPAR
jgi:threonine dehydrogenase-like Zn-dependent dehydrogenase